MLITITITITIIIVIITIIIVIVIQHKSRRAPRYIAVFGLLFCCHQRSPAKRSA